MRWRIPAICDILPPEGDLQYFQIPICLCKSADSTRTPLRNLYSFRTWAAELSLYSLFLCHLTDTLFLCSPVWVSDKSRLYLTSLASLCAGRKSEWHRLMKFLCWPCAGYRLSLFLFSKDYCAGAWQLICDKAGRVFLERRRNEEIRDTLTLLVLVACYTLSTLILIPLQERGLGEVVCCVPQPECLQTVPAIIADSTWVNAPQTLRLGKQLQWQNKFHFFSE